MTSLTRPYATVNGKRVPVSSGEATPNKDEGENAGASADSNDKYVMTTGSAMLDQFEPWYFGVAYAFLFKYCTGMPDMPEWSTRPRYRRPADAPHIPTSLWVRVMSRRVEAQLARDWNFGYASWNFLFRSTINLSRALYSYEGRSGDAGSSMTAEQLEEGAVSLCKALASHYKDTNGTMKPVKGDMTKLRYVPGLSRAAQRLLQNLEHTSRKVPGTQEVRRQMRFDTHANRVRYGVPIFVTFSPDEAHNLLMVRLSRVRRKDPVLRGEKTAQVNAIAVVMRPVSRKIQRRICYWAYRWTIS
jgi:hypothetical protein